jgi:LmbE family N-acetylglucosaminyl deacetylase
MMKLDILAFGAHPDDVELGCAGTILKKFLWVKPWNNRFDTRELGTRGSAEIRDQKQLPAAILGVSARENLEMRDGFFVNDENTNWKS